MTLKTDHLVVGADSVEQGVAWLNEKLGVSIPEGGEHPAMGTHNHLMSLGNGVFIEVIAVNPAAPSPNRPRWFALDDPAIAASLATSPKLLTWAVNTTDINSILAQSDVDLGVAEPLMRGDLNWLISIRKDGSLPAGGLLPAVLQWHSTSHPSEKMADLGCRLKSISLTTKSPEWLRVQLEKISAADLVEVKAANYEQLPGVRAVLSTPTGDVSL